MNFTTFLILVIIADTLTVIIFLTAFSFPKKIPGKILVIYNKKNPAINKIINSERGVVFRLTQNFKYIDLKEIPVEVKLKNATTKDNKTINFIEAKLVFMLNISNKTLRVNILEENHDELIAITALILRSIIAEKNSEEIYTEKFSNDFQEAIIFEAEKAGYLFQKIEYLNIDGHKQTKK